MTFLNWYFSYYLPKTMLLFGLFWPWLSRIFGVRELLTNLFSPWKKIDVEFLAAENENLFNRLITSLMSRLVGLFARTVALLAYSLILIVGTVLIVPAFLIGLIPVWGIGSFQTYTKEYPLLSSQDWLSSLNNLSKSKWFKFLSRHNQFTQKEIIELMQACPPQIELKSLESIDKNTPAHKIFQHWYEQSPELQNQLDQRFQLKPVDIERMVSWFEYLQRRHEVNHWSHPAYLRHIRPLTLDWQYGFIPMIDRYSTDLTKHDWRQVDIIGRTEEVDVLEQTILRPDQPFIIIHSKPGIGRTSLIYQFIKKSILQTQGKLSEKHYLWFDLNNFLHDQEQNKADQVLAKIIKEAHHAGNVVLVLQNIHELFESQVDSDVDIEDVLEDTLSNYPVPVIGVTSTNLYNQLILPRNRVAKLFADLHIKEPPLEEVYLITFLKALTHEFKHQVILDYAALIRMVDLAKNYIKKDVFPEKAIDLLVLVFVAANKQDASRIDVAMVDRVVSRQTGIEVGQVTGDQQDLLVNLEEILKQRVIDQDEAVHSIAAAIRRNRVNISDSEKPIGSFLFVGPTGVGKTSTALALAEEFFKTNELIRLDMAEHQTNSAIELLLGSKSEVGLLGEKILKQPSTVLLLDEFEKAPKQIHNLFLTVLDEGYFVTKNDTRIDCTNLVIIATSNAASDQIEVFDQKEFGLEWQEEFINLMVQGGYYSPELLNRFDQIIFFKPLTPEGLKQVLYRELDLLNQRLMTNKGITLNYDEATVLSILDKKYQLKFGVRSLQHFINNTVEDGIAKIVLESPDTKTIELNQII